MLFCNGWVKMSFYNNFNQDDNYSPIVELDEVQFLALPPLHKFSVSDPVRRQKLKCYNKCNIGSCLMICLLICGIACIIIGILSWIVMSVHVLSGDVSSGHVSLNLSNSGDGNCEYICSTYNFFLVYFHLLNSYSAVKFFSFNKTRNSQSCKLYLIFHSLLL